MDSGHLGLLSFDSNVSNVSNVWDPLSPKVVLKNVSVYNICCYVDPNTSKSNKR